MPDLLPPQDTDDRPIGKYGLLRRSYLKEHRKAFYTTLLTTGKLNSHLRDVEKQAQRRMELLVTQMAAAQGINEELKARDQMAWVGAMNTIKHQAEEVIYTELIYE